MSDTEPTDAELIAHYLEGTLIDVLHLEPESDRPDSLRSRLVELHNSGQINLLMAIDTRGFDTLTGSNFFSIQQVYCQAIPHLHTLIQEMMQAVAKLVAKGGLDGAAGFPYNAFRQWLDLDQARAKEIITAVDKGETVDKQFVAIALEALGDAEEAKRCIGKDTDEIRLAAISALGRIKPVNDAAASTAMSVLLPFCDGAFDEGTRFVGINAIFALLRHAPLLAEAAVPWIARSVSAKTGTETLSAMLQALWLQEQLFDRESARAVLKLAQDRDFTERGLAYLLDHVLQQMLGTPRRDLALDFLIDVLAMKDGALTLAALGSVFHRLAHEPRAMQFPLAVRCFVTADRRLCDAMREILTSGRDRRYEPFDASMADMQLSGSDKVAVCHKAIGFLMLHPVVSASVVVAALRAGDGTIEEQLIELLVYPILMNFQGSARSYLAGIKKGDPAYKAVRKALRQSDAYVKGAKIDAPIKELWPSDYERNLAAMKRYDQAQEIRALADEKSILSTMVHRSTLLYGRKSLTFVGGPDKSPVKMELKQMSFELPVPRLHLVDPVGYDWLMRIFQSSAPK